MAEPYDKWHNYFWHQQRTGPPCKQAPSIPRPTSLGAILGCSGLLAAFAAEAGLSFPWTWLVAAALFGLVTMCAKDPPNT